jgi:hypothetical protein
VAINTDVVDSTEMKDQAKLPLKINVRAKVTDSGVKKVSFYTEFWLVNKTGLRLLYRQPAGLGANEPAPGQVEAASDNSLWDLRGASLQFYLFIF